MPQMLGFELCDRIKLVHTEDVRYPYVSELAYQHIEDRRAELGDLLRRPGFAIQIAGDAAHFWTFAGGRVNHTLKYGLEILEGWKVVADNFELRIEGAGVGHETVRGAIGRVAAHEWWDEPKTREALLARLPEYRLSKFQPCLPEKYALEVVGRYLLDVEGTVEWLGRFSLA